MSKIIVPEGMLRAVQTALAEHADAETLLSDSTLIVLIVSVLHWVADDWNPSESMLKEVQGELRPYVADLTVFNLRNLATIISIASRRMFSAPESEVSNEMMKIFWDEFSGGPCSPNNESRVRAGLKAFIAWQEAGKK